MSSPEQSNSDSYGEEQPGFQPTPQHAQLQGLVGRWNMKCEFFMGGGEPMLVDAVEELSMLGPFWLTGTFEADMMGMPFSGRSSIGFNPVTQRWQSIWVDSMLPFHFHLEGEVDADPSIIGMAGKGPMPDSGTMVDYRSREKTNSDGSRVFEMWCSGLDGKEFQVMRYTCTRA